MSERKEQKGELVEMLDLDNEVLILVKELREANLSPAGKAALECMERLTRNRKETVEIILRLKKKIQRN